MVWVVWLLRAVGRHGRFENFRIGPSLSNRNGQFESNLEASQVPTFTTNKKTLRVTLQLQRLHVYNKSDRNSCICKLLKTIMFLSPITRIVLKLGRPRSNERTNVLLQATWPYTSFVLCTDLSPIPIRSAVKSYNTINTRCMRSEKPHGTSGGKKKTKMEMDVLRSIGIPVQPDTSIRTRDRLALFRLVRSDRTFRHHYRTVQPHDPNCPTLSLLYM